jgi:hypothetical protein
LVRRQAGRYRVASYARVGRSEEAPNKWFVESEQRFINGGYVFAVMPCSKHPATSNSNVLRRNNADAMRKLLQKVHFNAGTNVGVACVPGAEHDLTK